MTAGKAFVGHPVDVASGIEFLAEHDIEIGGVSPLIFRRAYSTAFLERPPTTLGLGWVHQFDARLIRSETGYEFEGHNGERISFDDSANNFAQTKSILNPGNSMELRREGSQWVIYHWHGVDEPVQKYVFEEIAQNRFLFVARVLPSGQGLSIGYDKLGRVATVTQNTEGRCLFFAYNELGLLAELQLGHASLETMPRQTVARYIYNHRSHLVAVYDAAGNPHRYEYDDQGRLVFERGRRGGEYYMKYDASGRCVETTGNNNYQRRRFKYDTEARITWVKDSFNHTTTYHYNGNGQILNKTLPNGAIYSTEFDEYGRITTEIGPLGTSTKFEFDAQGNLAKKTHPNGAVQLYEYDEYHQVTKVTDPDGGEWHLRYEYGALVERVDPVGRVTTFLRDTRNQLIGAIGPSGNRINLSVDTLWMLEETSDDYGHISSSNLDLFLNPTEIRDAEGNEHKFTYDALGRLTDARRPDSTRRQYEYDAQGGLTQFVDRRDGRWTASYSPYGECIQQTDPLGRSHRYEYDSEGRIVAIYNPKGELCTLQYDGVGNLVRQQHFDGSIEEMQYDVAGRMTLRRKPDGTELVFRHDELSNLVSVMSGGELLRSVKYDLCGEITEATSPAGIVALEYEPGGRIKAETQNGRRIDYAYNKLGLLATREFAGSKSGPLSFDYDGRGRLTTFCAKSEGRQTFSYDKLGRLTRRNLNETREDYEFDPIGRLTKQRIGGTIARTYRYDAEDSLIEVLDSGRGLTRRYRYDAADQILGSTTTYHSRVNSTGREVENRYQHDANGNLIARDQTELSYTMGDRLQYSGAVAFERDANGNVISRTENGKQTCYEWNALGELTRVMHPDGGQTTFAYDAFGRRTFKQHNAVRTDYFWSGDDLLAEETQENQREYALFSAWPFALWDNGEIRHIVTSHHGVPQELLDKKGEILWHGEYDDWGKLVQETGEITCDLRLQGQLADRETGLHYNRFRYYSPELGQFVSPDPIGLRGEFNKYLFSPNTIGYIDPLGTRCDKTGCGDSKRRTRARVRNMEREMSEGERSRTTYATAEVLLPNGDIEVRVAAAGSEGYVRPGIREAAGTENVVVVPWRGGERVNDAERHLLRSLQSGETLLSIGATRPMCPRCQGAVDQRGLGAAVATPRKD